MDFFARQERSRRATRLLVVAYLIAVFVIVVAVTILVAVLLGLFANPDTPSMLTDEPVLLGIAIATASFILLASLFRIASLSRGGGQVARMLGGTQITTDTRDPLRRRLINVVEEMAIASGTPVPEIFVLEQEQAINAFAAGLTPANAAVAVTQGALERLDRAELQGVVAHEFSHILNGDMHLNLRLMGLSFGILALSLLGRWLLRSTRYSHRATRNKGAALVLGLALVLIVVGSIGLFFGRLIKAGVSRQREALADSSAVQFTRDPLGLAEALRKIGGYTGQLSSRDSEEIAHMLFSRGSKAFRGWFATHPPLDERIRALDPSFTPGDYPTAAEPLPIPEDADAETLVRSLAEDEGSVNEAAILDRTGEIAPSALATALRAAIPEELHHTAQSTEASLLLVLALGLAVNGPIRERQLDFLVQQIGNARATRCRRLAEELSRMDQRFKLPLLELSVPALRQRPAEQLDFLSETLQKLADLNPDARLFDYVLLLVLASFFNDLPGLTRRRRTPVRINTSTALVNVLRCVASYGHKDSTAALAAFKAGMIAIGPKGKRIPEPSFDSMTAAQDLSVLDDALIRLADLRPRAKERVLAAILACIRHDRHIDIAELELFRAIAATLGCPVPPAAVIIPDP